MLEIIPAIDLLDNRVVRLKQGQYDDVTSYDFSAVELAQKFEDMGAKRLHIVDLNGAKDGTLVHGELIKKIRKNTNLSIEVGGGIRTVDSVHYYIDAGVEYVIIGSLFISNFDLAASISMMFKNKIIAGVDAKEHLVATDGWKIKSSVTLDELIKSLNDCDINSIIYTDISKDGMMQGPNIEMLQYVANLSQKPIIASGGIRHANDVSELKNITNILGCIIGKAILSNPDQLNQFFI